MAVKLGHASISENGTIRGTAGDQTGKEVCTRNWYRNSKGWVLVRCKDPKMLEYIAEAMEKAAKNDLIGYDQLQNQTLYNQIDDKGFDPAKVTEATETDCARLVRVCCQYACEKVGNGVTIPDFYTANLASVLKKTGLFTVYTASKYTTQDDLLMRGDILVTSVKGHTAVVLSNGSKVAKDDRIEAEIIEFELGDRTLKNGMSGFDVKQLQKRLNELGYNCGTVDGDFGEKTETAVKKFQNDKNLEVDGIVGKNTYAALKETKATKKVVVTGGTVNVRSTYNSYGTIMMIAKKNQEYEWVTTKNGWHQIVTKKGKLWISGKYSKIVEG